MGSAILQKTNPIPIPALNIMANQVVYPNSGFSSSSPSRIFPKRLNRRNKTKAKNKTVQKVNTQLMFFTMESWRKLKNVLEESVKTVATRIKTNMINAETTNTGGLVFWKKSICRVFISCFTKKTFLYKFFFTISLKPIKTQMIRWYFFDFTFGF